MLDRDRMVGDRRSAEIAAALGQDARRSRSTPWEPGDRRRVSCTITARDILAPTLEPYEHAFVPIRRRHGNKSLLFGTMTAASDMRMCRAFGILLSETCANFSP
jgi:hypothetical protein